MHSDALMWIDWEEKQSLSHNAQKEKWRVNPKSILIEQDKDKKINKFKLHKDSGIQRKYLTKDCSNKSKQ